MKFVDLYAQHASIKSELDNAIQTVIKESAFVRGHFVEDFERAYAQMMDTKHCISCANGTDAIYIALKALGIEPGDEVITTAHSWISTSETITQAGARVAFCDTEIDSFCIDPKLIENQITEKTKGIIVVHLYGQAADMDPILAIAKQHGLWVIEDCAQAHLAEYKGKKVGTMGDAATFSFYPGKNLGAMGDAGCLITNRDDIADFSTLYARHGGKNNHQMEGINSRMDGLQAAILNVKMPHLREWTIRRQQLALDYDKLLASISDITTPKVRANSSHVYHLYVIQTPRRDELKAYLADKNIPCIINYPKALPCYTAYAYLNKTEDDFPIASQHAKDILSLPMHPFLTTKEQQQVADAIQAFFA